MECKGCGAENDEDRTFCTSCGYNLRLGASPSNSTLTVQAPQASTDVPIFSVLKNAFALIMGPTNFLSKNRDLALPLKSVIVNYLAVLNAIPLVAAIIGGTLFYAGDSSIIGFTAAYTLEVYVLDFTAVIIMGALIWKLAPFFGTRTDQAKATMLAVYAATPFFILSLLDIFPYVGALRPAGLLYGLYILYKGLPIILNTRRVFVFVLAIFGVSVGVLAGISAIQYVVAIALTSVA